MTPNFNKEKYSAFLAEFSPMAIDSEEEYDSLLASTAKLMADESSPEQHALLRLMSILIEDYEKTHYSMEEEN